MQPDQQRIYTRKGFTLFGALNDARLQTQTAYCPGRTVYDIFLVEDRPEPALTIQAQFTLEGKLSSLYVNEGAIDGPVPSDLIYPLSFIDINRFTIRLCDPDNVCETVNTLAFNKSDGGYGISVKGMDEQGGSIAINGVYGRYSDVLEIIGAGYKVFAGIAEVEWVPSIYYGILEDIYRWSESKGYDITIRSKSRFILVSEALWDQDTFGPTDEVWRSMQISAKMPDKATVLEMQAAFQKAYGIDFRTVQFEVTEFKATNE